MRDWTAAATRLTGSVLGSPQKMDQQARLRQEIMQINADALISPAEKAKRIQTLMTEDWNRRQLQLKAKETRHYAVDGAEHKKAHYRPIRTHKRSSARAASGTDESSHTPQLGCKHYPRANMIKAPCCSKWFVCRLCHDVASDHKLDRYAVTEMMCMHCFTEQPAAAQCCNVACGKSMAHYFCKVCNLWDDDQTKKIYHCHDCGLCRIGEGLDKDYFHCNTCNVCMSVELKGKHKCIERNLESDCPICSEYMFTSTTTIIFMKCGHCIHHSCYKNHITRSYQCPLCLKSLGNMDAYFRKIDEVLEVQPMPDEYKESQTEILCNDCEQRCTTKYHFVYHKCTHCESYNTKVLKTLHPPHFYDRRTTLAAVTTTASADSGVSASASLEGITADTVLSIAGSHADQHMSSMGGQ